MFESKIDGRLICAIWFLMVGIFSVVAHAEPHFLTLPFSNPSVFVGQGWLYDSPGPFDCPELGAAFEQQCHKGIDYFLGDQSDGNPFDVVAAASGKAIATVSMTYGYLVYVAHDEVDSSGLQIFTLYAHLRQDSWDVPLNIPFETLDHVKADIAGRNFSAWRDVQRGDKIGTAGDSGESISIHLHFEVQRGGYPFNKTDPYDIYATRGFYPTPCQPNSSSVGVPQDDPGLFWTQCPPVLPNLVPTWTHLTPVGSGPKQAGGSQSTAYDVATDTLIVFGGSDPLSPCCVSLNDTWVLKNATGATGTPTWEELAPAAPYGLPSGRGAHSAVYDPATNRMIIFGGGQPNGFHFDPLFNDVWVLTHANGLGGTPEWVPRFPTGASPAPREGHGAFYKQSTNEMFVFGGGDNGIMSVPGDLWVLKDANSIDASNQPMWVQVPQTGDVPGRIEHFATAYDPVSNRMTIAGGCCFYTNTSRVLDFNDPGGIPKWTALSPGGELPPIGDALLYGYDRFSNHLIVHGISPGSGTNATWLLKNANNIPPTPMWVNSIPRGATGSPTEGLIRTGSAYNPSTKKFILTLNRIDGLGNLVPEVWVLSNADQE